MRDTGRYRQEQLLSSETLSICLRIETYDVEFETHLLEGGVEVGLTKIALSQNL